ncbi:hypothetical protein ATEIFO6365_0001081900 [Aspergillus terreus]|uniref:Rhodopsin domain-containing protein n=1 Tax=Aspergillus terreus TaxID=33178 RepID=A0A5M3YRQ6_ASPTE|nr:hypothetical protein ATETN484_0001074000 [Aspergillus terreus]GFF12596.1 hypothetical protein ATEIFO6365_0001081900 [Aspergillus terreus]
MYTLPVSIVFITLAVIIVLLRLYTRYCFVRTPGWDDAVIVAALLADIVFFTFIILEIKYGMGKDQSEVSPHDLHHQLKALWASIPLYNLTLNFAKASVTLLYMRLFSSTKDYRIILVFTLVAVIITGLYMVFSTFFFCTPVRAFWDRSIPDAYCLPEAVIWPLNAGIQISTDAWLVILPMPVLFRLRLPRRQKCALIFVFALGLFVCATSIVRLVMLINLIGSPNLTKENTSAATWSFIEANVAIICACLAPLRPLIAHVFPRLLPSRSRSTHPSREKTPLDGLHITPPFPFMNTAASVTGNCSSNNDARRNSEVVPGLQLQHSPVHPEGTIHVTSEVQWQTDEADSTDEQASVRWLEPVSLERGSS